MVYHLPNNDQFVVFKEFKTDLTDLSKSLLQFGNNILENIGGIQHQVINLTAQNKSLERQNAVSGNTKKEPNRIEKIIDEKSGITVHNHYENNRLVKGEMFKSGKKKYEFEYGETGKVICSRNYNERNEVISETKYYENGQVQERIEFVIKNGQKVRQVSKFDKAGNKLS